MISGSGRLAILGGGGHGRVVADCALAAGWSSVTIFDDGLAAESATGPWLIAGDGAAMASQLASFDGFIVAIGHNPARLSAYEALAGKGIGRPAIIIHPAASVSPYAEIGAGSVVVAGAVVNIGARIGGAAIINTGASVDHDCVLGDGVHISPGARLAGGVKVGRRSWIGAGAVVRERLEIGSDVILGAGAVVIKSVLDDTTVVGNPARIILRSRS